MSNYNFHLQASERAKVAYESVKVDAKRGTSFKGLRKYTQNLRESLLKKREELDSKKAELQKTYQFAMVDQLTRDSEDQYKNDVVEVKKSLTTICERIANDKREANQQFAMIPPSEEIFRLINAFCFRDKDSITDTEWNYIVSTAGNNYQALRMIEKLAKDCDRSFVMPYTPDDTLEKIKQLERITKVAIENISVPDNELGNSEAIRFFNYDGEEGRIYDPYVGNLIEELDSFAGSVVPDDSIIERLKAAQKKAYDNDDIATSAKINAFLEVHGDKFRTPVEIQDSLVERAEELIKAGNQSKK